jgi:uncharacterized Zn-binding protein involved in type VI secretion
MSGIARLGDSTSHGGSITGGCSANIKCNGIPIATEDSVFSCPGIPPHGGQLGNGKSTITIKGRRVAYVGMSISCGGTISSGDPNITLT